MQGVLRRGGLTPDCGSAHMPVTIEDRHRQTVAANAALKYCHGMQKMITVECRERTSNIEKHTPIFRSRSYSRSTIHCSPCGGGSSSSRSKYTQPQ